MENYQNSKSEWILENFYDNNTKYLDNSYIGDKFITDIIYFSYYVKNPIFYMIFAQKYLFDNKMIYDYYNDYSITVKYPYEYRFKSALLLPSLNDYDKNMLNEADITFIDDPRFRFEHLNEYMKWFHTNYAYSYDDEHIECLLSKESNETSKKFIRMHVDNMLNHRKSILKFLSRYSSIIKCDDFAIYDNHFISRIRKIDLDLLDYNKFVEQFINDLYEMNRQYVHSVLDIIKNGIIKSGYIENADDIESVDFYINKDMGQLYKNSEYFKSIKDNLLDNENYLNNTCGLFRGALHLLWTNYYHWQPYCEIYNNMMSYNFYPNESMFKSLCDTVINMVNVKYKNNSNKLFYKSYYVDVACKLIENTEILNSGDNINILNIISMNIRSFNSNDITKFIFHHIGDVCRDMMSEYEDQIHHAVYNLKDKYNIINIEHYCGVNYSALSILCNFINNKPFLFHLNMNMQGDYYSYDRIRAIFQEDNECMYLNSRNESIYCTHDHGTIDDILIEFDSEYQKIIKSLKNKYLDEIKDKIYNIKIDNDIETIICKMLYLYPDIVSLVPNFANTLLCDKTDNIDSKLFNNLIKHLNGIENEQENIIHEFRGDSYLKIIGKICEPQH